MRGTGRKPPDPCDQVPGNRTDEGGHDQKDRKVEEAWVEGREVNNIFSNRLGYRSPEEERADEFTQSRHGESHARAHGPCRDKGCHDVGGIVEAIGEAENERKRHNQDEVERGQTFDGDLLFTDPQPAYYLCSQLIMKIADFVNIFVKFYEQL